MKTAFATSQINKPLNFVKAIAFTAFLTFANLATAGEQFFDQRLDHFSVKNKTTFKHRYVYDASHSSKLDAPLFIFLGLESPMKETYMDKSIATAWAKQLGAHILKIEHRYYGKSSPFTNLTPTNLRYLTWVQALNDIAEIQKFIQKQNGLTGPVVVFGNSYSASLATFYKLHFPNLANVAVGYSEVNLLFADVNKWQPKFTASQREQFVASKVSSTCQALLKEMQDDLDNRYKTNKLFEIKKIFDVSNTDDLDFLAGVADLALVLAQFEMNEMCQKLEADPEIPLYKKFYDFGSESLSKFDGMRFKDFALSIGGQVLEHNAITGHARQFQYQHCSQTNQPFIAASLDRAVTVTPEVVNLPYQKRFCKRYFNVKKPFQTLPLADQLIEKMLNDSTEGIVLVNGELDHWKFGSMTAMLPQYAEKMSKKNLYIQIENGFHCPTTSANPAQNSEAELKAQGQILEYIKKQIGLTTAD